jgi:hypothetical protein
MRRPFCTHQCLAGLLTGAELDRNCPHVDEHGADRHAIDQPTFLRLLRRQLGRSLDDGVHDYGTCGARGAFFKVTLLSHGYTVAGKASPVYHVKHLRHESKVYERLRPLQGRGIPVHLGSLDLPHPYPYAGYIDLVHMMFMSFGGVTVLRNIDDDNRSRITAQTEQSLRAMHRLGVLHRDALPRNILWHPKNEQVMLIDFERAELRPPPKMAPPKALSPVCTLESDGRLVERINVYERELQSAMLDLGATTRCVA